MKGSLLDFENIQKFRVFFITNSLLSLKHKKLRRYKNDKMKG